MFSKEPYHCLGALNSEFIRLPMVMRFTISSFGGRNSQKLYAEISEQLVIEKIHPVFAAIFAAILLNEPFDRFEQISATFCFTGVVLASKPSFLQNAIEKLGSVQLFVESDDQTRTFGLIYAALAPIVSAAAHISVRKAGPGAHYLNHMFSLSVTSVTINAIDFQNYVWPQEFYPYLILFGVVFVSFISQCLFNRGLQLAPSGAGTLMCMNEIVLAFIFGMFVFGGYPDYLSTLGTVIIVVSCSAIAWKKWKSST
ncbi:hypothetical protein BJV82DRAFT_702896 [Fennellomyces sp. T-0311]|nr:hypothetical protein BJV82DRAFT_702896 [Fennellomyces sp. T-0311]